jgi:hypothetical protein
MQRLAEIGVLGMALPQEYGGSGLIVGAKPFNLDNLAFTLSTKAQLGRTTPGVVPNLKSVLEEVGEVSGFRFALLELSCRYDGAIAESGIGRSVLPVIFQGNHRRVIFGADPLNR